jgi:replicative DNA helicase
MTTSDTFDFSRYDPKNLPRRGRGGGDPQAAAGKPLGKLFDREAPFSAEAEISLLGSMILDPNVIGDVMMIVRRPEDFYIAEHGWIFRALIEVFDRHHSGDLVQTQERLRQMGVYEQIGGEAKLLELAEAVPAAVNAPFYARIVADKAKLRRLIDAAGKILYDAYHVGSDLGPEGVREVIDVAETKVFEIAEDESVSEPQELKKLLQDEIDRLEAQDGKGFSGVPTGYTELDDMLRGLQPGELVIIAARPSMGKTALALNLAEQIALGGLSFVREDVPRVPIGFFSLEMSKSAVTQRLISARSGISSHNLRSGHGVDFRRVIQACGELEQAPIFVDDTPNMTVMTLRARARRLVRQHGIKCIMIDYLQLLTSPGAARESRQVEVSTISRGIKALARELDLPVVCLAQLNRASEQREGNRPRMADLRESGSIEQDADVIILLHREDYYHVQDENWAIENPDKIGVAELIIAKQRNGPTGVVKLKWDAATTRFKNLDEHAQAPMDIDRYNDRPAAAPPPPRTYAPPPDANEPPPFDAGRSAGFAPGRRTGPVDGHRDGGGPDRSEDGLDDLPV